MMPPPVDYADTTEDDFHRHLDAHPNDHQARMVFADWLQEHDDPRAEGYRALGALRRAPAHSSTTGDHFYGTDINRDFGDWVQRYESTFLPHDWFSLVPSVTDTLHGHWRYLKGRRGAEDAAALAFSQLPPERRAEILDPPTQASMYEAVNYSHDEFHRQINEHPDDLTTRGVYADWVEENEPNSADEDTLFTLRHDPSPLAASFAPDGRLQVHPAVTGEEIDRHYGNLERVHGLDVGVDRHGPVYNGPEGSFYVLKGRQPPPGGASIPYYVARWQHAAGLPQGVDFAHVDPNRAHEVARMRSGLPDVAPPQQSLDPNTTDEFGNPPTQASLYADDQYDLSHLLTDSAGGRTGPEEAFRVSPNVTRHSDPYGSHRFVRWFGGVPVSALQVMHREGAPARVVGAYTVPEHRRLGHASALLNVVRSAFPDLEFDTERSAAGDAWVRANTGGDADDRTDYADEGDFVARINENPLDVIGHRVFADWLQEQQRPADESFRRSLADSVERRLNTWTPPSFTHRAGPMGIREPTGRMEYPEIDENVLASGNFGDVRRVTYVPWLPRRITLPRWTWGTGAVESREPGHPDLFDPTGAAWPYWGDWHAERLTGNVPWWNPEHHRTGPAPDGHVDTGLMSDPELWAAGVTNPEEVDATIWPQIEAMLRHRHDRGLRFSAYDIGAAPVLYGHHSQFHNALQEAIGEHFNYPLADPPTPEMLHALQVGDVYQDVFRDEGRDAHAAFLQGNAREFGDPGIWGVGSNDKAPAEGQTWLSVNPNGYDSWTLSPPNSYTVQLNVNAGTHPYRWARPGEEDVQYPNYRRYAMSFTKPEEAYAAVEALMNEGAVLGDDDPWGYDVLREHVGVPRRHQGVKNYLNRWYEPPTNPSDVPAPVHEPPPPVVPNPDTTDEFGNPIQSSRYDFDYAPTLYDFGDTDVTESYADHLGTHYAGPEDYTHSNFVHRIFAEPHERSHALVYADWLDEVGHTGLARIVRDGVAAAPPHVYTFTSFNPSPWTGFSVPAGATTDQPHVHVTLPFNRRDDASIGIFGLWPASEEHLSPEHTMFRESPRGTGATYTPPDAHAILSNMAQMGVVNADKGLAGVEKLWPELKPPAPEEPTTASLYGDEENFRSAVAADPLDLTAHRAFADFLAERNSPEELFRRQLAHSIEDRLQTWRPPQFERGRKGAISSPRYNEYLEGGRAPGGRRHLVSLWPGADPETGEWAWLTKTAALPKSHPNFFNPLGGPLPAEGRWHAARLRGEVPWFDIATHADTDRLSPAEQWGTGVTDPRSVDPAIWPQIEAMLKDRFDRGEHFAKYEANMTSYADPNAHRSFHEVINANPQDMTARGAYADMLDEEGGHLDEDLPDILREHPGAVWLHHGPQGIMGGPMWDWTDIQRANEDMGRRGQEEGMYGFFAHPEFAHPQGDQIPHGTPHTGPGGTYFVTQARHPNGSLNGGDFGEDYEPAFTTHHFDPQSGAINVGMSYHDTPEEAHQFANTMANEPPAAAPPPPPPPVSPPPPLPPASKGPRPINLNDLMRPRYARTGGPTMYADYDCGYCLQDLQNRFDRLKAWCAGDSCEPPAEYAGYGPFEGPWTDNPDIEQVLGQRWWGEHQPETGAWAVSGRPPFGVSPDAAVVGTPRRTGEPLGPGVVDPHADYGLDYGEPSPEKAREMLHDGTVHGHPITERQRRYFGYLAHKSDHGAVGEPLMYADEGDFLRSIDSEPGNPATHGAYADWLDEQGRARDAEWRRHVMNWFGQMTPEQIAEFSGPPPEGHSSSAGRMWHINPYAPGPAGLTAANFPTAWDREGYPLSENENANDPVWPHGSDLGPSEFEYGSPAEREYHDTRRFRLFWPSYRDMEARFRREWDERKMGENLSRYGPTGYDDWDNEFERARRDNEAGAASGLWTMADETAHVENRHRLYDEHRRNSLLPEELSRYGTVDPYDLMMTTQGREFLRDRQGLHGAEPLDSHHLGGPVDSDEYENRLNYAFSSPLEHPEGKALWQNVLMNPHDTTARKVYIDWLKENGFEGEARHHEARLRDFEERLGAVTPETTLPSVEPGAGVAEALWRAADQMSDEPDERASMYGPAEEEQGFLHSIAANPDDATIGLAFADWLRENGRPEEAQIVQDHVTQRGTAGAKSGYVGAGKNLPDWAVHGRSFVPENSDDRQWEVQLGRAHAEAVPEAGFPGIEWTPRYDTLGAVPNIDAVLGRGARTWDGSYWQPGYHSHWGAWGPGSDRIYDEAASVHATERLSRYGCTASPPLTEYVYEAVATLPEPLSLPAQSYASPERFTPYMNIHALPEMYGCYGCPSFGLDMSPIALLWTWRDQLQNLQEEAEWRQVAREGRTAGSYYASYYPSEQRTRSYHPPVTQVPAHQASEVWDEGGSVEPPPPGGWPTVPPPTPDPEFFSRHGAPENYAYYRPPELNFDFGPEEEGEPEYELDLSDLEEPQGPEEDDYTTDDHRHWYQNGKLVVTVPDGEDHGPYLRAHAQSQNYYPNAWFVSDHGNAHPTEYAYYDPTPPIPPGWDYVETLPGDAWWVPGSAYDPAVWAGLSGGPGTDDYDLGQVPPPYPPSYLNEGEVPPFEPDQLSRYGWDDYTTDPEGWLRDYPYYVDQTGRAWGGIWGEGDQMPPTHSEYPQYVDWDDRMGWAFGYLPPHHPYVGLANSEEFAGPPDEDYSQYAKVPRDDFGHVSGIMQPIPEHAFEEGHFGPRPRRSHYELDYARKKKHRAVNPANDELFEDWHLPPKPRHYAQSGEPVAPMGDEALAAYAPRARSEPRYEEPVSYGPQPPMPRRPLLPGQKPIAPPRGPTAAFRPPPALPDRAPDEMVRQLQREVEMRRAQLSAIQGAPTPQGYSQYAAKNPYGGRFDNPDDPNDWSEAIPVAPDHVRVDHFLGEHTMGGVSGLNAAQVRNYLRALGYEPSDLPMRGEEGYALYNDPVDHYWGPAEGLSERDPFMGFGIDYAKKHGYGHGFFNPSIPGHTEVVPAEGGYQVRHYPPGATVPSVRGGPISAEWAREYLRRHSADDPYFQEPLVGDDPDQFARYEATDYGFGDWLDRHFGIGPKGWDDFGQELEGAFRPISDWFSSGTKAGATPPPPPSPGSTRGGEPYNPSLVKPTSPHTYPTWAHGLPKPAPIDNPWDPRRIPPPVPKDHSGSALDPDAPWNEATVQLDDTAVDPSWWDEYDYDPNDMELPWADEYASRYAAHYADFDDDEWHLADRDYSQEGYDGYARRHL